MRAPSPPGRRRDGRDTRGTLCGASRRGGAANAARRRRAGDRLHHPGRDLNRAGDPSQLLLAEAARLIERRELAALELTESYLARIERLDATLGAFITLTPGFARADARAADAEIGQGRYRGPLHGIPIGLKDVIDTAGVPTTAASRRLLDRVPTEDALVVSRLRRAGAVILGKLNLYEWALGPPREGDAFPPARNPWDLAHGAGGSSSGSSAAVCAQLCAAALGTDAAGSVRRPAAESGVVGVKATQGLVSQRGLLTHCWTIDGIGPLARSVEDCAIVLDAIAGVDEATIADYRSGIRDGIASLRVAVPWSFIRSVPTLQPAILEAVTAAVEVFKALGADVREVEMPLSAADSFAMINTILYSEVRAYHASEIAAGAPGYGLAMRERFLSGAFYTGSDYVQAQRARGRLARELGALLRDNDVLLTPTMPHTSPSLAEEMTPDGTLSHVPYTRLFNLSGQPSISLPCGQDAKGLPIGLLLSARHFDERTMFRAAYAYEQATLSERRPWPYASEAGIRR